MTRAAPGSRPSTEGWSRRSFLRFLASVMAAPTAFAFRGRGAFASDFNRFRVAQVTTGGLPPARPDAALVLAQEVRARTAVQVRLDRVVVPLGSRAIFESPFLLWVGERALPPLNDREVANLQSFLSAGGFLVVDNAGEGGGFSAFDRGLRTQLKRAFPGRTLQPVPADHVLMRTFYRVTSVAGRHATYPELEALDLEDRLALVYSRNDLTGAWSRDGFGNWEFEAVPGGPSQRESAIRLGINLVMYALLLDYKDEQAHIEYLLKKRRLRPEDLPDRPR